MKVTLCKRSFWLVDFGRHGESQKESARDRNKLAGQLMEETSSVVNLAGDYSNLKLAATM